MRGRIKEDDFSVPSPDGALRLFAQIPRGRPARTVRPHAARRRRDEIVLDGDELAAKHEYFKFGGSRHSPDHKLRPGAPTSRARNISPIRVRDWDERQDLDDLVEETDGAVVWSADSKSFFYVKLDDNHRPLQVCRHRLGTKQADDILIYEEQDAGWFTHIHESRPAEGFA